MIQELIPVIDSNYRTEADQRHRAMAGLSMGSMQTLQITLRHLDQFAWIGAMSGPPRQGFDVKTSYDGAFTNALFNQKVKLLAGRRYRRNSNSPEHCCHARCAGKCRGQKRVLFIPRNRSRMANLATLPARPGSSSVP